MTTAAAKADLTTPWRERFEIIEGLLPGAGSPWLRELRRQAISRFVETGFPTPRWEAWRYFDPGLISRTSFKSAAGGRLAREMEKDLLGYLLPAADLRRAVFVNGAFAPAVSNLGPLPPGVMATSLSNALAAVPEMVEPHFGRLAVLDHDPFVALNTAFTADGFVLHLQRGAVLEEPLHLVFLSEPADTPSMTHPRVLIVLEDGSRATVVESFLGPGTGRYLTNKVTEIVAGRGTSVEHFSIQEEGAEAFHVAGLRTRQGPDSRVRSHVVMLGGATSRNDIGSVLDGPGAECALNGLFVAGAGQVMDTTTLIDHAQPHGTSREFYKGVLDGRATGSFTGRVVVRPGAQRTDAAQTNRNLLLSDDAVINTRPQLEIYADDVKCSHGATTGQLDPDAVFYLRSRGIDQEQARIMLTRAFVDEIIDLVGIESLRSHLHSRIDGRVARFRRQKETV